MARLKVIIAGAGLGGLCLAQALRRRDIDVEVYERDANAWDRPQGYRLHIDTDGVAALQHALPPEIYRLFDATAMKAEQFTTIVDTELAVQRRVPCDVHGGTEDRLDLGAVMHVNVDRVTLRQILLIGLETRVHFGRAVSGYESDENGVTLAFEDGATVEGDVLVGADGIGSVIRQIRAPNVQVQDAGVRALYGRLPIDVARTVMPAQALEDVFTVGIAPNKVYLGLGPVIFPTPPARAGEMLLDVALKPCEDFAVCIVGGRVELFSDSDEELAAMTGTELQAKALALMADWPEAARAIPASAEPDSFFFIPMYSSVPANITPDPRVTLLGDAIHGMTPSLGRGANTALRDAGVLARHLEKVVGGTRTLAECLAAYEEEMVGYAWDVVRQAAMMGNRLMGQNPLPN